MGLTNLTLHPRRRGISLVELLIAMGLIGTVSLGIVSVYIAHYRLYLNQNALIQVETQNKLALDEITRYAREGLQFSDKIDWQLPNIGFRLAPLDPSGNPYAPFPEVYDHAIFEYDSVNKTIIEYGKADDLTKTSRSLMQRGSPSTYLTDGLQPPRIIATGVTVFSINYPNVTNNAEYLNSNLAEITITTESKTAFGKTFTSDKTATIFLRR